MNNQMAAAFAPCEAKYYAEVAAETWGHLAPEENKSYTGMFAFSVGCFGDDGLNPTPIKSKFKGLADSPWFYDSLTDFISDLQKPEGTVWEWRGMFRNYKFKGTLRRIY